MDSPYRTQDTQNYQTEGISPKSAFKYDQLHALLGNSDDDSYNQESQVESEQVSSNSPERDDFMPVPAHSPVLSGKASTNPTHYSSPSRSNDFEHSEQVVVSSTDEHIERNRNLWSLVKRNKHSTDTIKYRDNIRVAVRIRPFIKSEEKSRRIICRHESKLVIVNPNSFETEDPDAIADAAILANNRNWAQTFDFHNCLWSYRSAKPENEDSEYADQNTVYMKVGTEIIENVLNGVSCSCFAYGHTGTGKTYTMLGDLSAIEHTLTSGLTACVSMREGVGLIPRIVCNLIESLNRMDDCCNDTKITMSCLEIYNEKINDLLLDFGEAPKTLRVREHQTFGPYVENLTKEEIDSFEKAFLLLARAQEHRKRSETPQNPYSSRSHLIVTIELTPTQTESPSKKNSKPKKHEFSREFVRMQLVDLAGSEKEMKAPTQQSTLSNIQKAQEVETRLIRRSLSTLGYVIKALSKGDPTRTLPYRDSVLTWLLKDSLTGKTHTTMLATISPSHLSYEESLNTLKYAHNLFQVSTLGETLSKLRINENPSKQALLQETNFDKMRESLGANIPGTQASRVLLQETVADPQQRIAKVKTSGTFDSGVPESVLVRRSTEMTSSEYTQRVTELEEAYRTLQGRLIELQIELETSKRDQDNLLLELQAARDASDSIILGNMKQSILHGGVSSGEKGYMELREILLRKEEHIGKLSAVIEEEKQSKVALEVAMKNQANDFAAKTEALQRQNANIHYKLEAERRENEEHRIMLSAKENLLEELREALASSHNEVFIRDQALERSRNEFESLVRLHEKLKESHQVLETSNLDMKRTLESLKSEVTTLQSDKATLKSVIERQAVALQLQSRQSETSIKIMQKRQSALETYQQEAEGTYEELGRLQDIVQNILSREGDSLSSELSDMKRLATTLGAIKERIHSTESVFDLLETERKRCQGLEKELEFFKSQSSIASPVVTELKRALETSEKRAIFWEDLYNKLESSKSSDVSKYIDTENKYVKENEMLREQLDKALLDASRAREELEVSKESMQQEFASLWMAVHELNRMDAVKDKEMQDISKQRDEAFRARDIARAQVEELEAEIKVIDKHLMTLAEVEDIQVGVPKLIQAKQSSPEILQSQKTKPTKALSATKDSAKKAKSPAPPPPPPPPSRESPRPITPAKANAGVHGSQRTTAANSNNNNHPTTRPISPSYRSKTTKVKTPTIKEVSVGLSDDAVSESILERQIQELTDFLHEDRGRIRENSKRLQATSIRNINN